MGYLVFNCAICGNEIKTQLKTHLCYDCYQKWDKNSDWVQVLIQQEEAERKRLKKEIDFKVGDYSQLESATVARNVFESDPFETITLEIAEEEKRRKSAREFAAFWKIAKKICTPKEIRALKVHFDLQRRTKRSLSQRAAQILSNREDKPVSADAYRQRKSTAFRKINAYQEHLNRINGIRRQAHQSNLNIVEYWALSVFLEMCYKHPAKLISIPDAATILGFRTKLKISRRDYRNLLIRAIRKIKGRII